MQPIIDTHIHIWNFDKAKYEWLENDTSILNRSYDIDELQREKNGHHSRHLCTGRQQP
jgi:predicted TIM-barrel fold metal-dependent hydrolase